MLRRHNYVTPTSYLELLAAFKSLLSFKRKELTTKRDRLQTGLDKIISTKGVVGELDAQITALRPKLAAKFNLCGAGDLESEAKRRAWAGYGVVDVPAQENDPSIQNVNFSIGVICDVMTAGAAPYVDALAAVSDLQHGGSCVDVDVAPLPADDGSDFLSWPWQTCTEFGFYQTCEVGTRCPFARGYVGLDDEIGMCEAAFGVGRRVVADNVAFSNAFYGGDQRRATGVFFRVKFA